MAFPTSTLYPQTSGLYPGDAIAPTPDVVTLATTNVATTTATINGTVDPNGASTTYLFLYGTSEGYGSSTALTSAGSGSSPVAVAENITGLTRNRLYRVLLVGFVGGAGFPGGEVLFYTLSSIHDPPVGPLPGRLVTSAGRGQ